MTIENGMSRVMRLEAGVDRGYVRHGAGLLKLRTFFWATERRF